MSDYINVAVDGMGGDNAPAEIVKGSVEAVLASPKIKVYITGTEERPREELAKYGFDQPRAVITVHMAEGTTLVTDEAGSAAERDWPEETLTFTVGSARNELVDYVCFRDTICTVSRFMVSAVTDTVPLDTLTRYPVRTSLSNLKRLTVDAKTVPVETILTLNLCTRPECVAS